jgi:DNA polymerase-3 subunit beta
MKVRCDKNALADCLGDVLGFIPTTQASKPILMDFRLWTDGGQLVVEATDLDMGARIRVERVEVLEDGEVALPANRLYSVMREIPDKAVTFEGLPGGRGARVAAGGYELKMLGEDPHEFPQLQAVGSEGAVVVGREKLAEMLRRVAIAASRDVARFQLTGVFFEIDGDKLILTATDGKRLTNDYLRIHNPSGAQCSAIIPNRVVDVVLKILAQGPEDVSLVLGDPNFQLSFGRGELTAKAIQGTYPDYRVAIEGEVTIRITARRLDFLAAARSASLMTDKQSATVLFRFEEGRACLTTQASEIGESRIEVPITLEGEPFEVRYNPTYFIDALRCLTDEELRLEFTDPDKPGAVRGAQHYRHLVMPLVTAR